MGLDLSIGLAESLLHFRDSGGGFQVDEFETHAARHSTFSKQDDKTNWTR